MIQATTLIGGAEVVECLNKLVQTVESHQLPAIMESLRTEPPISAQLVDEFTGPMILKYPRIKSNRESKLSFCRLCPQGTWLLTISSIGLLKCQEVKTGKNMLLHCVGDACTDAVIDSEHKNILLASSSNGHKVYCIDTKTMSKTNITHLFVSTSPQRTFKFYPMENPNHVVVGNNPSSCYDIINKNVYHQIPLQEVYANMSSTVRWEPNRIELKKKNYIRTWFLGSSNPQTTSSPSEKIKDIKKILYTQAGIIGFTKSGTVFHLDKKSIEIIGEIEGGFSDIDIKQNTMAVSYFTGDVALFKIYRVTDLIKAYQKHLESSDSETDDESD